MFVCGFQRYAALALRSRALATPLSKIQSEDRLPRPLAWPLVQKERAISLSPLGRWGYFSNHLAEEEADFFRQSVLLAHTFFLECRYPDFVSVARDSRGSLCHAQW